MGLTSLTNLEREEVKIPDNAQLVTISNLDSERKILSNFPLNFPIEKLELTLERFSYVLRYVKKVEKIDVDERGEPAFYVSYEDWINYVKNSDLQAIVFPTKDDFDYLDALERVGIKIKSVSENDEAITILIDDCEKLTKAEYIVFVYSLFNTLSRKKEFLPTCIGYSREEMIRHLDTSLEFLGKYLGNWYE